MQKRRKNTPEGDHETEPEAQEPVAPPPGDAAAPTPADAVPPTAADPAVAAVVESDAQRAQRLETELAEARQQVEQLNQKYLRALADLENYRRRARQEHATARREGEAAILLEVLPALDDFARALEAAQESNDVRALMEGVKMIHERLHQGLARRGVRVIEAEGKPFDPLYHDAVGRLETTDHPEGTVAIEIQKGYMLGDRVLRPARVMVAVRPEAGEGESGGEAPPSAPEGA